MILGIDFSWETLDMLILVLASTSDHLSWRDMAALISLIIIDAMKMPGSVELL